MISQGLSDALRAVAEAALTPVVIILLALIAVTIILLGTLIAEFFTERRHLKVKMPVLINQIRAAEKSPEEIIAGSGLIKKQKETLKELVLQSELTNTMREALAVRLLAETRARYDGIVNITNVIAKIGPMLGLLGTLIPLGPGIIALGRGDTYTLSTSLLTAFDTTVAGLICAAIALIVSVIRKKWYADYMSMLETLMECILDKEKKDDKALWNR